MTTKILNISFVLLVIILNGCTTSSGIHKNKLQKDIILFVIKDVNIIPMTKENKIIENATVVINDSKIVSINERIPDGAKIIDGKGKWLIPGLIDMHVHTPTDNNYKYEKSSPTQGANVFIDTQDVMLLYIANGVTTVFELNARAPHFSQRNEIAKGIVIGPRMALAALIDGGEGNGRIANNANDGRQAVRSAKAEGYRFIKVYSALNIETFKAIVDEAHKQGLKVLGHIPDAFAGHLEEVFIPHFDMVAHTEEYSKQSQNKTTEDAKYFAKLAKDNNTWLTSSLTTMIWIGKQLRSIDYVRNSPTLKYLHPLTRDKWLTSNSYFERTSPEFIAHIDTFIDFQKKMIKEFNDAGVPIVAGTDAGIPGVVGGFALQDELGLMVDAGMTNEEVLISATRLPAEWLGIDDEVGTVEKGKYADLILLDQNPLENIKNTQTINGVFVNGKWIDKNRIKKLLSELERKNSKNQDKFKWKERMNY
ncbi:amidohydrolase family protein [Chryseobacterium sp. POE27]|uniref:amidohydrolase family protein n=1 Tax=Chryseobacterium sp. POE27 TaxID=3138177 RepID=UPI00321ABF4C